MAFTLIMGARHSLAPPSTGGNGYDAAGFASCYGPHRRSPFTGLLTLGSDPARFPAEPPACYRASWQLPGPDFHRQATTSLRTRRSTMAYVTVSPPALLGARKIRASGIRTVPPSEEGRARRARPLHGRAIPLAHYAELLARPGADLRKRGVPAARNHR